MGWLTSLKPLQHAQRAFELVGALLLILSGLYMLNAYFFFIPDLAADDFPLEVEFVPVGAPEMVRLQIQGYRYWRP